MKKVTSILLALVMALSVLFCALPALAADNEKAIEAAAAYDRHSIGLKGVKNARELGGYQTTDGRTVMPLRALFLEKLLHRESLPPLGRNTMRTFLSITSMQV